MHVLCVACINHCDGVTLYGVGEVPLVGVGHVVALPSADGRCPTRERLFYRIDIKDGIVNVALHVFKRVSMAVFQGYVPIKCPDVPDCPLCITIFIRHPSGHIRT